MSTDIWVQRIGDIQRPIAVLWAAHPAKEHRSIIQADALKRVAVQLVAPANKLSLVPHGMRGRASLFSMRMHLGAKGVGWNYEGQKRI